MAAEFYITFKDKQWLSTNLNVVKEKLRLMQTVVDIKNEEYWLLGKEHRDSDGRLSFDVRIFLNEDKNILIEISAHPTSIEIDLSSFLAWLRSQTEIIVADEDGEHSNW